MAPRLLERLAVKEDALIQEAIARSTADAVATSSAGESKRKRGAVSRVTTSSARRFRDAVQDDHDDHETTETTHKKQKHTSRKTRPQSDSSILPAQVIDDDEKDEDFSPEVKSRRAKNARADPKQYSLRQRKEADVVVDNVKQETQKTSRKKVLESENPVATKATKKILTTKTRTKSAGGSLRAKQVAKERKATESKASLSTLANPPKQLAKKKKLVRISGSFTNKHKIRFGHTPFPKNTRPSRAHCHTVFDLLKRHHERDDINLEQYLNEKDGLPNDDAQRPMHAGEGVIFDAIVRTILSQATNNENAQTVEKALIHRFRYDFLGVKVKGSSPNYHAMRRAPVAEIAKALASGGLHNMKAKLIKGCLDYVYERNIERVSEDQRFQADQMETGESSDFVPGMLSLDYMKPMSLQEKFDHLVSMPGIGVKTAACILSFNFEYPVFAVDTHVWRLSKMLRWLPRNASNVNHAFMHLDKRVPNELKYGLHQAFWHHGQYCIRCRAGSDENTKGWKETVCPIEEFVDRSCKDPPKMKKAKRDKEEKAETPEKVKKRPNVYPHAKLTPEQAAELGYELRTIMIDDGFGVRRANFNGKPLLKWVLKS